MNKPLVLEAKTPVEKMLLEELECCQSLLQRLYLGLQPLRGGRLKEGITIVSLTGIEGEVCDYLLEHDLISD